MFNSTIFLSVLCACSCKFGVEQWRDLSVAEGWSGAELIFWSGAKKGVHSEKNGAYTSLQISEK